MNYIEEIFKDMSSREIAKKFFDLGIKGKILSGTRCPLANIIKNAGAMNVCVDKHRIVYAVEGSTYIESTPSNLADFMDKFDRGYYPDLVSGY